MSRINLKHLISHGAAALCFVMAALTTACTESIDTSARYVFKERTIASYLEDHPQFSEYLRLLQEQKVSTVSETTVYQLMTAYGYYTCFAPTNEAIQLYLDSLVIKGIIPEANWNSFPDEETLDSIRTVVVLNSILDGTKLEKTYITAEFPKTNEEFEVTTMADRKISVTYDKKDLDNCRIDGICPVSKTNRDIETINLELIFADLETVERRIARVSKGASYDKAQAKELEMLKKIKDLLENGQKASAYETDDEDEIGWLRGYSFLTRKPVIYAANVSDDDIADDGANNAFVTKVRAFAAEEGSEVFVICARLEEEISELEEDERKEFLTEMGLEEAGLEKLIRASYHLLGLISFLTTGPDETRAWTITRGMKAPQAAGKIHTDFERGFIRAEVVAYDDLVSCGGMLQAKEKGLVRSEGKEYVVKDGDVILFRFNV